MLLALRIGVLVLISDKLVRANLFGLTKLFQFLQLLVVQRLSCSIRFPVRTIAILGLIIIIFFTLKFVQCVLKELEMGCNAYALLLVMIKFLWCLSLLLLLTL